MTLADIIAVMRRGYIQQIGQPQQLYQRPASVIVAIFLGSAAMNLVEARLVSDGGACFVEFGDVRLRLDDEAVSVRPARAGYAGRQVVLGIRPGQMKDAALTTAAPPTCASGPVVDLREELGEESLLHYRVAARAVLSEDVEEARGRGGRPGARRRRPRCALRRAGGRPLPCRHRRRDRVLSRHEGAPPFDPRLTSRSTTPK